MSTRALFLTTNGVGLGHLTRSMAIARRLPSNVTPVIFTTSQALPVVRAQGFYAEYLYSVKYADMETRMWNALYERRLMQLIEVHDPAVVVYDGTYPYRGLVNVMQRVPSLPFVWTRRAMWRPQLGAKNLAWSRFFHTILEPGEFAAVRDAGATVTRRHEARSVAPILLLDRDELPDRASARRELGLDDDAIHVLVQLGSYNTADISSATRMCVDRLRRRPQVCVTVAESTVAGEAQPLPDGVRRLRSYPLSRYFPAFDFSLSGAGYNAYHELIGFGLPALFVPNRRTALDDQAARAYHAESLAVARVWEPPATDALDRALSELLDDDKRAEMAARLRELAPANGAAEAARVVAEVAESQDAGAVGAGDSPGSGDGGPTAAAGVTDPGGRA